MSVRELPFEYVERQLRKKHFGFVGTVTPEGRPHSAGIVYVVSPPDRKLSLYFMTGDSVKKTKNLRSNPNVSFSVPFAHHWIRMAPDFCIQFQGRAEILPFDDPGAREAFRADRFAGKMLEKLPADSTGNVFIRITPDTRIFGFGLGISLLKLLKDITNGRFATAVPADRL